MSKAFLEIATSHCAEPVVGSLLQAACSIHRNAHSITVPETELFKDAVDVALLVEVDGSVGPVAADANAEVIAAWTKVRHLEPLAEGCVQVRNGRLIGADDEEIIHVDSNEGSAFVSEISIYNESGGQEGDVGSYGQVKYSIGAPELGSILEAEKSRVHPDKD
jgi:hypothetical protein